MYFNMPDWLIDKIIVAIPCIISIILWWSTFSSKDLKEKIKSNGGEPVPENYCKIPPPALPFEIVY